MSWGFIIDLEIPLPKRGFATIKKRRGAEIGLPADWSGFSEPELLSAFAPPAGKATFAKVLQSLEEDHDARITEEDSTLRVLALLDRSQLDLGGHLAALLVAVGKGTLALVNDGTYSGDAGRTLTIRDGALVSEPIPDDGALLEELTSELGAGAPAAPPAPALPAPPPVTNDPAVALRIAFDLYKAGNVAGARDYVRRYFDAGHERRADLWHYYVAFLRNAPGEPTAGSLDFVEQTYAERPSLLREAPSLENAIAVLNTHGRAPQSLALFFRALDAGVPWVPTVVGNACHSAWVADDAALTSELLRRLEKMPEACAQTATAQQALASMRMRSGDIDGSFAAITRCVELEPARREGFIDDADWAPLRGDPRWAALFG